MKVFLAGASGALGKSLVPRLIEHEHTVIGTTTTEAKTAQLAELGATPVVLDLLDRDAVIQAVVDAQPDAIVHEATALSGIDLRHFERSFELTNRLRTEGTDNLLAAAQTVGISHVVAQSFAGWPYARTGGPVKGEQEPLDTDPPKQTRATLEAIRHLEAVVTEAGGIVLRYGGFYGPGTGLAADGDQLEAVRGRKFPLVGHGRGTWSFIHIDDAAAATVAALERGKPGIYNIVDDEPAPVAEWLPYLADVAGAKPPRHLPPWVAQLVGGKHLVLMMEEARGASNEKARRELGWEPAHHSWREGFPEVLVGAA
jgi:nucleoside-diphosphate-sugar epimerase